MSIRLSRKKINDMVDRDYSFSSSRSGGGSGAGGGGGVSSQWVDDHYVSKEFFARLFTINGTDENDDDVVVEPNDLETTITNIQAMVGLWTESYLSALGLNSGGGGGGGSSTLYDLNDVQIPAVMSQANDGQVLMYSWSARKWINSSIGTGTITDVTLEMPTGFDVSHSTVGSTVELSVGFGDTLTKNQVLATPSDVDGSPLWRSLVLDDLPDIPWSKIGDDSKPLSWWGQNSWDANGAIAGSLSDVTNIDSLLYFDTTNSYIGLNTSSPEYHIDVIGQLRFRQTSSQTASCVLGCFEDSRLPFVRFRDPDNNAFDIRLVNVGTNESPNYGLEMGRYNKYTDIIGVNIRMYSKTSADTDSISLALRTIMGGRVAVGAADSTLTGGNTDCKLVVNGNACTAESNGSFMQIGLVRLVYDSANNALKVIKKDGSAANFYATGAVSALGANSQGGGGGGVSLNTLLTSLNSTSLNPATVSNKVLVNSSGTWTWQNYTSATGTVTSVGMTVPTGFSVSPSSITSSGTFAVSFGGSVTKNYVLASPSSAAGAPSWRALVAADIPSLDAGKITSGTFADARIPNLAASKITSGTFADARIPNLAASKITSGTFDAARIPNLSASKITSGTLDAARIPDLSGTYATDARMDTVEGYFDSSGHAKTALKLSTVSKTAWGQTYWTANGVPDSVSGDMSNVGDITASSKGTKDIKDFRSIEMYGASSAGYGGWIDFHYNGGGSDYTSRIIEDSSGKLKINNTIWANLSGNVGIGNNSPSYKLDVTGVIHCTTGLYSAGYVTALSDIRYKDVVAKVSPRVEDIAKASIIRYTWKFHADKTIHIGGIAQEWKVILPETVIDGGDKLSMDYGKIGAIAGIANARRIVDHEERIKQLEKMMSER